MKEWKRAGVVSRGENGTPADSSSSRGSCRYLQKTTQLLKLGDFTGVWQMRRAIVVVVVLGLSLARVARAEETPAGAGPETSHGVDATWAGARPELRELRFADAVEGAVAKGAAGEVPEAASVGRRRHGSRTESLGLMELGTVLLCGSGLCVWQSARVERRREHPTAVAPA